MKIKHWISLVKDAINAAKKSDQAWQAYFAAEYKIHHRQPLFGKQNKEIKNGLGVNFCQLTYGPDDKLFDASLQSPDALNCSCFTANAKCTNKDCPVHAANNAYFDAKKMHEEAMRIKNNATRRVFGLKTK